MSRTLSRRRSATVVFGLASTAVTTVSPSSAKHTGTTCGADRPSASVARTVASSPTRASPSRVRAITGSTGVKVPSRRGSGRGVAVDRRRKLAHGCREDRDPARRRPAGRPCRHRIAQVCDPVLEVGPGAERAGPCGRTPRGFRAARRARGGRPRAARARPRRRAVAPRGRSPVRRTAAAHRVRRGTRPSSRPSCRCPGGVPQPLSRGTRPERAVRPNGSPRAAGGPCGRCSTPRSRGTLSTRRPGSPSRPDAFADVDTPADARRFGSELPR